MRRSATTLIVHLSDDAPPFIEGAGPLSRETAERLVCDARRLTIKLSGRDLVHSRVGRCASYRSCARCTSAQTTASTRAAPPPASSKHTTSSRIECGGRTKLVNLILLCHRHHKLLHDQHIHTGGTGDAPTFTDAAGRPITTNQPHAPPH